ncbi:GntP family permease [Alkaliphilus pronyensis]|uniref:GntP family permease n=1 Tax=Alkaliphilus pronyensis TaxID=1482732 RepID=A0A6I0F6P6_9FIRM|nr:GntP family permease [Alkaliphilus pronyensis]KAB3533282.1 GntP family permease [Alkaliphilus pronyensis]
MLGIVIGLLLLMYLAYRGWSIIWIAPICATVVALFGGVELLPNYTESYMGGFVAFAKSWFPVFMLGAIFGKLMEDTGAAKSVAKFITKLIGPKRAILGVVAGCGVLTYGGVSLFVVVFAIYPLAVALFREANISRKLIPAAIALGSFTFTMTAFPGTPQIQNLIPMEYFRTTPTAAPIIGLIAGLIMAAGGYMYLVWTERKLTANGDGFIEPEENIEEVNEDSLPNPFVSFLPLVSVIVTLNFLEWNVIPALLSGIILIMALNYKMLPKFTEAINKGAAGSVIAIINTSAAVGFGAVVRAVPGFTTLTDFVLGIEGNPLISEAIAVNLLAGATGSASGGLGIALAALGEKYYQLALSSGMDPAVFHRVASLACGGLDSLPHNGAVLTLLAITGMTHKKSYLHIFVVATVIPVLAVIVAIILASMGVV